MKDFKRLDFLTNKLTVLKRHKKGHLIWNKKWFFSRIKKQTKKGKAKEKFNTLNDEKI